MDEREEVERSMFAMLNNPTVSSYVIESNEEVMTLLPMSFKSDKVCGVYTDPSNGNWEMEVDTTSMVFIVGVDNSIKLLRLEVILEVSEETCWLLYSTPRLMIFATAVTVLILKLREDDEDDWMSKKLNSVEVGVFVFTSTFSVRRALFSRLSNTTTVIGSTKDPI